MELVLGRLRLSLSSQWREVAVYCGSILKHDINPFCLQFSVPTTHPKSLVLTRISGVTAGVSWTPLTLSEARGFVTNYEISYWTVGSEGLDIMSVQVSGDANSTVLTGLDPNREYYVTVSVSTAVGKNISTPLVLSREIMGQDHGEFKILIMHVANFLPFEPIVIVMQARQQQ